MKYVIMAAFFSAVVVCSPTVAHAKGAAAYASSAAKVKVTRGANGVVRIAVKASVQGADCDWNAFNQCTYYCSNQAAIAAGECLRNCGNMSGQAKLDCEMDCDARTSSAEAACNSDCLAHCNT